MSGGGGAASPTQAGGIEFLQLITAYTAGQYRDVVHVGIGHHRSSVAVVSFATNSSPTCLSHRALNNCCAGSRLLSAKNDDPPRFGMGLLHRSVFSTRHDVVPVA